MPCADSLNGGEEDTNMDVSEDRSTLGGGGAELKEALNRLAGRS